MPRILAALAVLLLSSAAAPAADVGNVDFRQEGNRVVVTYDLAADGPVPVSVTASKDGGQTFDVKMDHVTGDVGEKVAPGKGRRIVWEPLLDYPRGFGTGRLVVEVATAGGAFVDPVTGMELVFVKGGTFDMGDTFGDGGSDEKPVHRVTVSDFWMGRTEVTQAQWKKVMASNPSSFKGADRPVENVSWNDAQEFVGRLRAGSGRPYRLPSEAEWEYAARSGGRREKWAGTDSEAELGEYAWYGGNAGGQTQGVATRRPNGLGLYDLSGNVWEWCQDRYGPYDDGAQRDPAGPAFWGADRVCRGGSWYEGPGLVRAARRNRNDPGSRIVSLGFRLALSPQ